MSVRIIRFLKQQVRLNHLGIMPAVNKHPVDYNVQSNDTHDKVRFIRSKDCCVCFVNIADSTRITSAIDSPEKARKYYDIFLVQWVR